MRIKNVMLLMAAVLLPLAANAATFIVPAAGTGPGANDSHWQSELTMHNTGASALTATLRFHDAAGAQQTTDVTINARSTVTIADIVNTRFGRESATGAIEITIPDASANRVAITSRTFNVSASGQFGQDIPAVNANDAAGAGDVVVLQAPSSANDARFNFGLYAVTAAKVRWELVRADGTAVTPIAEQTYAAGTQLQFNQGIANLLGQTQQDNDAVHAVVTSGKVIAYGSAVQNMSGDPSFVPGIRVRSDIRVNFLGVDVDEDGTIDVADADHDGVLDHPIDIFTLGYPNFFRVVVEGGATLEIVEAPSAATLVDAQTIEWSAPGDMRGTNGVLKVRATVNGVSEILTIPANFR
ncbi:MAG: hypothetical protein M3041_10460 [Acidobacteriota bacterium]|nr:hypothetical protein [Acidobacteriota bacterium]